MIFIYQKYLLSDCYFDVYLLHIYINGLDIIVFRYQMKLNALIENTSTYVSCKITLKQNLYLILTRLGNHTA